jgi:uncharacterized membrane protein YfcA
MALAGLAPEAVRPAALVLNIVVAGLAAVNFLRTKRFAWGSFWPFAVSAIPMAYLTGQIEIPAYYYRSLLALALGAAALRYLLWPQIDAMKQAHAPSLWVALPVGGVLGALAGLTGIGGGVFLSPLLVFAGWADPKRATGIAALFIVVNSGAGLAGQWPALAHLPAAIGPFALAAALGGLIGSGISISQLNKRTILRALGLVLGVAAAALAAPA